jgi:hypothetical protein
LELHTIEDVRCGKTKKSPRQEGRLSVAAIRARVERACSEEWAAAYHVGVILKLRLLILEQGFLIRR